MPHLFVADDLHWQVEGDWDASNFDAYPEIDLSEYGNMTAPDPHGHLFPLF